MTPVLRSVVKTQGDKSGGGRDGAEGLYLALRGRVIHHRIDRGSARVRRSRATPTLVLLCAVALTMLSLTGGCGGASGDSAAGDDRPAVVTDTTFLADIVQNVAGERMAVSALLPVGSDPHSFEPTPQDAKRIAKSSAVVINVLGLEPQLDGLLADVAGADVQVIEAAAGVVGASEDPHVWLDPILVMTYVENIARKLSEIDPIGGEDYRANAEAYRCELQELDRWIVERVATVPVERKLLVTNHDSLGYFAGRYGFKVVGKVFPTVSGQGAPSAQQIASLVREIEYTGAPAIFLETGANVDLAAQIARESGVTMVTDLYVASVGEDAPTYLDMMRRNVEMIVKALR